MKKTIRTSILFLLFPFVQAFAQQAVDLGQVSMDRWKIGSANYSGIAPLGGNRYVMVSDKEPADGFFTFRIDQNTRTGEIVSVYLEGFTGNPRPEVNAQGISKRDTEGIAYVPSSSTVFISGEGDQRILEYSMEGRLTGRELQVPDIMRKGKIISNYGFEALTYSPETHRFWTTTESTLPQDGPAAGPRDPHAQNVLRLVAFDETLHPVAQYAYRMDRGKSKDFGRLYIYGVPELLALPDGKVLVMEREAHISANYLNSQVTCKLFEVNPPQSWQIDSSTDLSKLDTNRFLVKKLLASFTTRMTPIVRTFANYEGMCLGCRLDDGRQTILLVNDSQAGYGKGPIRLKDYLRVLILP